jgi:transcriptional regulator of acetoin/glycerol metabolism
LQNKVLRNIADAPWYIRNANLHRDIQMEMFKNEIGEFVKKHEERLLRHINVRAIQPLDNSELGLKKNLLSWCSDY